MNTSQGEDINQRVFDKLNEIERKKMGIKIERQYPEVIKRAFPNDQILNANQAVKDLMKATNLDESVVRNCLAELIDQKEFVPSWDSKGSLHLAKMKKLY